jgi:hypothetical protein
MPAPSASMDTGADIGGVAQPPMALWRAGVAKKTGEKLISVV